MRRDPRSLLELRRLAYHTPRDHAARLVLHDALLETVPAIFERYVSQAHEEDKRTGLEQIVWFRSSGTTPHYIYEKKKKKREQRRSPLLYWFYQTANLPGSTSQTIDVERAQRKSMGFERGMVIVYRTRGRL